MKCIRNIKRKKRSHIYKDKLYTSYAISFSPSLSTCLEAEFEVFAAPDIEARIVGPEFFEPTSVNGEQPPGHGGRGHRLGRVGMQLLLPVWDGVPVELRTETVTGGSETGETV